MRVDLLARIRPRLTVIAVDTRVIFRSTVGPRRSRSSKSLLRSARAMALVAVLILAAGIVSDAAGGSFWERHALIAGVIGSSIVVWLSVAVVNVTIERWRRERWKVLAQYVMLELILNARVIWTGIAQLTGNMQSGPRTASALDAGSRLVRDTSSLARGVEELLADSDRRGRLHNQLASLVDSSDEVFGRWAGVMLSSNANAEVIDRHVELTRYISWLGSLLDPTDPSDEGENQTETSRRHHHPAIQFEGDVGDDRLANRIVTLTQLAEELDRVTVNVALKIIPATWWADRFGIAPPIWSDEPETYSYIAEQATASA